MKVDQDNTKMNDFFRERSLWLRRETLKIHNIAPETRIASALSSIEILVVLYYGKILRFDPKNIYWEGRDRFIISKGMVQLHFIRYWQISGSLIKRSWRGFARRILFWVSYRIL
jgi:transketolase N-terminal domain/subunit